LRVRVTNANCVRIKLIYDGSAGGTDKTVYTITSPVQNQWYDVYVKDTPPSNVAGFNFVKIQHDYASAAESNGQTMEIDGNFIQRESKYPKLLLVRN
jgi:hypothetical protein